MNFSDRQIHNLFEIARIVYLGPEPSELCAQLATRICPQGELVKVYLAKLDHDGFFKTVAAFGYSRETKIHEYQVGLVRTVPMSDAYLRSEVLILNRVDLAVKYPTFQTVDQRSPWESLVVTPTASGGYVFVFRLQVPLVVTKSMQTYFEAIGKILSFYKREKCQSEVVTIPNNIPPSLNDASRQDELKDRPLTKRQRTILALIQEGLTNAQIAGAIGYSESLVRQETILIYAKLGVRGRVDLRAESLSLNLSR
jgi:DNA-binding CsgD family transcriptional regulator